MPRAVSCELNGQEIRVPEALVLREQARKHGEPTPGFRCLHCHEPVRPHRGSSHGAPHFEHGERNPHCPYSDPPRG